MNDFTGTISNSSRSILLVTVLHSSVSLLSKSRKAGTGHSEPLFCPFGVEHRGPRSSFSSFWGVVHVQLKS